MCSHVSVDLMERPNRWVVLLFLLFMLELLNHLACKISVKKHYREVKDLINGLVRGNE